MNVVYGGTEAFNAIVYQNQHPSNYEYFKNQVSNISSTLDEVGKRFFNNAQVLYDQINSSEAMRIARAAVNQVKTIFQENTIHYIDKLENLQNACVVMQRWIMANPTVRQQYHLQKCDGYSDTYVDMQPDAIGQKHYDYRRVMNNVIQDEDDSWVVRCYPDELHHGDRELQAHEKFKILSTWEIINLYMEKGEKDPTSIWNNDL